MRDWSMHSIVNGCISTLGQRYAVKRVGAPVKIAATPEYFVVQATKESTHKFGLYGTDEWMDGGWKEDTQHPALLVYKGGYMPQDFDVTFHRTFFALDRDTAEWMAAERMLLDSDTKRSQAMMDDHATCVMFNLMHGCNSADKVQYMMNRLRVMTN